MEKEGKWVENPCPILLVECPWWSKHHEAKDRESIYLRNNNVLVISMAVNHGKTTVGSEIQHVTSKMVSPSMAGRSEYRHASPHGQHGPTYHCWNGPSGRNGRVKSVGQTKSVNHTMCTVGCVGLTSGTVNHTLGGHPEERGWARENNPYWTTKIKSSEQCVGLISESVNHTEWKELWVFLTSRTAKKTLGVNLEKQSWDRKSNFCGTAKVKEKLPLTKSTNLWEKDVLEKSSADASKCLCRWQKIFPPIVGKIPNMIIFWSTLEPWMARWKWEKCFPKQIIMVKTTLRCEHPNHSKNGKEEKQPSSNICSALSFLKNWLPTGFNFFLTSCQPLKILRNGHASILSRKTQGKSLRCSPSWGKLYYVKIHKTNLFLHRSIYLMGKIREIIRGA